MSELKPCPFCGDWPVICEVGEEGFYYECSFCWAQTRCEKSIEEVTELWNMRAIQAIENLISMHDPKNFCRDSEGRGYCAMKLVCVGEPKTCPNEKCRASKELRKESEESHKSYLEDRRREVRLELINKYLFVLATGALLIISLWFVFCLIMCLS